MSGEPERAGGELARLVASLRDELGDDTELLKQALSDFHALERQNQQQGFEIEHQTRQQALEHRKEYARQIDESNRDREVALKEYGMQALKWAFIMNAGAAGLLLGYIGTRIGTEKGTLQTNLPLLRATLPFAFGCILVTAAGLAGYANFSYLSQALPSSEALFNFFNTSKKLSEWPRPKGAHRDETIETFYSRNNRKINLSRTIAIACGVGAILSFVGGLALVFYLVS